VKNLEQIPESEKHYYVKCEVCNDYFDCRNLNEVVVHLHEEYLDSTFTSSRKVPEPFVYLKGRVLLNQN
jgi:hypothetical protein